MLLSSFFSGQSSENRLLPPLKKIFFGRSLSSVPEGSLVFFPLYPSSLACGLAGLMAFKKNKEDLTFDHISPELNDAFKEIIQSDIRSLKAEDMEASFLGGKKNMEILSSKIEDLRSEAAMTALFNNHEIRNKFSDLAKKISERIMDQKAALMEKQAMLSRELLAELTDRLEKIQDIHWHLSRDFLNNMDKIKLLCGNYSMQPSESAISVFHRTNTVLNSIEILEVRGRDSAGISIFFTLSPSAFKKYQKMVEEEGLTEQLAERSNPRVLVNQSIAVQHQILKKQHNVSLSFTYKIAAEIGSLGDNGNFLRSQIKNDPLLHLISCLPRLHFSVAAHTRWASVGEISVPNCHPVDNQTGDPGNIRTGIIQVALNGDIDNYLELKKQYENRWDFIPGEISTDTKIIPLQIEHYLREGKSIEEAFRCAVSDFEGSHAIWMQTDLAPDKLFLAQKGSGQAIFVGIGKDGYIAASEVYGFVESTPRYIKIEGEKIAEGIHGPVQGQVFILDENPKDPLQDIHAFYYDGTPVKISEEDLRETAITSRDIDRQHFPHYFIKEISESPRSVARTLQGRFHLEDAETGGYTVNLEENAIPLPLQQALKEDQIRRIFFIGQGTASIAAQTSADLLRHYLNDPAIQVQALKASELSGFFLEDSDGPETMADALVVAISQSGTTTDTNRSVDMVRSRGARTIGIVNRRDSDLTFKVEGVLYTSSGRDIEMSVASTKAFYSQVVAGALLGLQITQITGKRRPDFISTEIRELLAVPEKMEKVLSIKESIGKGAKELAVTRLYWATVGSGPNKNAADEIRIKLSELCYRTISSDYVEDKKHIDLSAEPLIFVCAAGTRPSVIGDIIKDTAIFHAHKALPVVVVSEGDHRFDPYASQIIPVPDLPEHLAPLLTTLAGHIWGYHAALAIHEGSRFFYEERRTIMETVQGFSKKGMDIHEIVLEKRFREEMALFGVLFRKSLSEGPLHSLMDAKDATDLLLLTKYLSGRLPVSDIEMDFGKGESIQGILNRFFEKMGKAINLLSRPVDAIKHQAKTVTVGTSRIKEKAEGILFEALEKHEIHVSQLSSRNILVLRNLQGVISAVNGAFLYKVEGLNLLGDVNSHTSISLIQKTGSLSGMSSRTEKDPVLRGSKRIIVQEGNVFIGQGKKDGRRILIIPAFSGNTEGPRLLEYLLSLDVDFHSEVPLFARMKALGGKLDRIRNNVNEYSVPWKDEYLDLFATEELFGLTADRIVEEILKRRELKD
ncbi:SIS domain-containing protein [Desulfobotulus mexicanus]|uniref:Glutamine--fructose-6-phosphate aminotransferase [isomerizing] n=1 Tax=Desulfobotulus mexicanus TaxID=2586642 RepID=A0A5Q4VI11_9BACT|nr:SIS domain-containing protein [Desulfobotulus mexicanus]TYT75902.1 SIS domain-containing protein [Desulfobotulus mexicanus]